MIKKFGLVLILFFVLIGNLYAKVLPTFVQEEGAFIGSNEKTTGVAISPDGTKIFVMKFGDATDISLYQYTLDTAFDISSKNAGSEQILDLAPAGDALNSQAEDITFNNDGTKLFAISDDGAMNIHTLSTPYDISSGVTLVADDGINWRTYKQPWGSSNTIMLPQTIRFNNDGTKMYLTEAVINSSVSVGVVQYDLATPFVPSSTTSVKVLNVRAQFPADNVAIHAMNFDDDGTRMYVSAGNFSEETDHPHAVYQLSEPFEITSATHVGTYNHFGSAGGKTRAVGGVFSSDGLKYYMTTGGAGAGKGNSVIEYNLSCPFGLVICESEAEAETVTSAQVEIAKNVIHQNSSNIFKRFDWIRRNEDRNNLNSHNIKIDIDINNPVLASLKNHLKNSLIKNQATQVSLKNKKPTTNQRNWSYWSHGDISLGRVGNNFSIKSKEFKTKGIMFGADKLVNNKIFGYAFRYGNDEVEIKSDSNNELDTHSFTFNIYGNIPLKNETFLNALIGASFLSMDQLASGSTTGERNGKQIFTSISYENENKYTKYDLVPFGKFQMGITQFSEYTDFHPTSGGIEKHNRLNFRTGAVSAGFKFENVLYLNDKTLSRHGFIEYIHDLTPEIEHTFTNHIDKIKRTRTIKKHSLHSIKGNIGYEYINFNGYTFAINYERHQSLGIDEYNSGHTDSLFLKFGKKNKEYANLDFIYQPMNNNKAEVSYIKELGNFVLNMNSNYSLFSKIPDYGANIKLSGAF